MQAEYYLYSSEGCHLCEQALQMCNPFIANGKLSVIDIVEQEELVEQYGVHIPVLERLDNGEKLYWPFTPQQINELITEWN
ncbi:glutaredoxin family protein [Thalassotalea hakodatensis]|uniref:glutaredoxin family protein n=1 Tax=Thalassotalea hakodatensis TaxID=3030492 RepID=UPI0025741F85|nr:glutaredoxin family protein [Thalassotalea hakodatensis]